MQTWPAINTPYSGKESQQKTHVKEVTTGTLCHPQEDTLGPSLWNHTQLSLRTGKTHTFSKVCKPDTGTGLSRPTGLQAQPMKDEQGPPTHCDGHTGMHICSWEPEQKEGERGKKGELFIGQVKIRIGAQYCIKAIAYLKKMKI